MKVSPETGMRVSDSEPGLVDFFFREFMPLEAGSASGMPVGRERPAEDVRNQLF